MKCSDLIPQELVDDTPHAPAPKSSAENEWVNFGLGEVGQLNIANRDKRLANDLCKRVEALNEQAQKNAERRNKPWYKRIF